LECKATFSSSKKIGKHGRTTQLYRRYITVKQNLFHEEHQVKTLMLLTSKVPMINHKARPLIFRRQVICFLIAIMARKKAVEKVLLAKTSQSKSMGLI